MSATRLWKRATLLSLLIANAAQGLTPDANDLVSFQGVNLILVILDDCGPASDRSISGVFCHQDHPGEESACPELSGGSRPLSKRPWMVHSVIKGPTHLRCCQRVDRGRSCLNVGLLVVSQTISRLDC